MAVTTTLMEQNREPGRERDKKYMRACFGGREQVLGNGQWPIRRVVVSRAALELIIAADSQG
jgi:hypothetical protein